MSAPTWNLRVEVKNLPEDQTTYVHELYVPDREAATKAIGDLLVYLHRQTTDPKRRRTTTMAVPDVTGTEEKDNGK